MKIALVAMLALVCVASNTEARQRHRVAHQLYSPECNVSMPCEGVGKPVVSAKESRRLARGQELYDAMPFGMPTDRAGRLFRVGLLGGRQCIVLGVDGGWRGRRAFAMPGSTSRATGRISMARHHVLSPAP